MKAGKISRSRSSYSESVFGILCRFSRLCKRFCILTAFVEQYVIFTANMNEVKFLRDDRYTLVIQSTQLSESDYYSGQDWRVLSI